MWCIWDVQVEEGLPLETCDTLHNNVSYVGMWCVGMWFVGMWCVGMWFVGMWCVGMWFVGMWFVGMWCVSMWFVGMWCVGMWFVGMWYMWDVQVEEGLPLETCDTLHNNGAWGYTADHTPRPVDQVGMEGCVCIYCNTLQHTPAHSNAR